MIFSWSDYRFDVSETKIYRLPSNTVEIVRHGFRLVIAVDSGNWIVLENDVQRTIFYELKGRLPVSEVLLRHSEQIHEIHYVIVQLEGRHFEFEYVPEDYEEYFSLRIYLTNNCNLRCRHCFMYADKSFENELTPLETAKNLGLYTQVLSNGTLWSEITIDELSPLIDEIQISIDGFDEQSNSEIRGKNTFHKALKTVDDFIQRGNFVSISMTPLYDHIEKFYDEYIRFGRALVDKYPQDKFLILFAKELLTGRHVLTVTAVGDFYFCGRV